jgi:hypothetical protein
MKRSWSLGLALTTSLIVDWPTAVTVGSFDADREFAPSIATRSEKPWEGREIEQRDETPNGALDIGKQSITGRDQYFI